MRRADSPTQFAAASVARLWAGAIYLTPLGLLCKLLPAPLHGPGSNGESYLFGYVDIDGKRLAVDHCFRLSRANVAILRETGS